MSPFLLVWAFGFLVLSLPMIASADDPDGRCHPAVIFLVAAWPLLLVLGMALLAVLWVLDAVAGFYLDRRD